MPRKDDNQYELDIQAPSANIRNNEINRAPASKSAPDISVCFTATIDKAVSKQPNVVVDFGKKRASFNRKKEADIYKAILERIRHFD